MEGEKNLAVLLRSLEPYLDPQPYVFCTVSGDPKIPWIPLGLFRETEGLTLIITPEQAQSLGQPQHLWWACLSLQVHSDLTAVGLLATLTQVCAQQGIPVNAISAYYHDHLFVPWEQRFLAQGILRHLSQTAP